MMPAIQSLPFRIRCARLILPAVLAVAFRLQAGAAETPSAVEADPPAGQISAWIEQLAAEQFAQREAATRSLAAAGRGAIEPLRAAIGRGDLEISSRAVEILREMLGGEDAELATTAESTLETLAEGADAPVASMAEATLEFHNLGMAEAAREKLESLGAIISEGFLATGQRGLHIQFNAGWSGKSEDFRLLCRLRGVIHVGVHGVPLDEAAAAALGRLRGIEKIDLFGTGIGAGPLATLTEKLPDAKIDVRKGGKLGVGGQSVIGPCVLTQVQEGSAAARAGIQTGDIVLTIDGEPVANFESLTDRVGRRGPGEKIEMEIERGVPGGEPQRMKRTVELGGWD
ncbi:MAG: PDZ domain-containing protein [Planctomycetes bacterium]|nr:PDZ domain-containing protein [Planctomycetota bacterium]